MHKQLVVNKVYLGSDHAGFGQKEDLKRFLTEIGCEYVDCGPFNNASVDYPDYARLVCEQVITNPNTYGILFCGSGVGVSVAANKFLGIRAGLVDRKELAHLAVAHDNCNVLCLSARFVSFDDNCSIVQAFLTTPFEQGRHCQRIDKIRELENDQLAKRNQ